MRICSLCRKERKPEQLQEGRALCIDRRACQARAVANLAGTSPAQSEALRLSGATKRNVARA